MKKIKFQLEHDRVTLSPEQIKTLIADGKYSIEVENGRGLLVLEPDADKKFVVKPKDSLYESELSDLTGGKKKPLHESELLDFARKNEVSVTKRIYRTDKNELTRPDLSPQANANRTKKDASLRLTEEFLTQVDNAAKEAGISRTEWITLLIAKELEL